MSKQLLKKYSFRGVITLTVLFSAFFLFIPSEAQAGRGFGKWNCQTISDTPSNGSCTNVWQVCEMRFFWINIGTSRELLTVDCSGVE